VRTRRSIEQGAGSVINAEKYPHKKSYAEGEKGDAEFRVTISRKRFLNGRSFATEV
jgi:hypothetical protein